MRDGEVEKGRGVGDLHLPSSRVTLTCLHSCQSCWFANSISIP